ARRSRLRAPPGRDSTCPGSRRAQSLAQPPDLECVVRIEDDSGVGQRRIGAVEELACALLLAPREGERRSIEVRHRRLVRVTLVAKLDALGEGLLGGLDVPAMELDVAEVV